MTCPDLEAEVQRRVKEALEEVAWRLTERALEYRRNGSQQRFMDLRAASSEVYALRESAR